MSVMELLSDNLFGVLVSKQYHQSLELSETPVFMRLFEY